MLSGNILKELLTEYVEEYTIARNFSEQTLRNKRELFLRLSTFLGEEPLNLSTLQQYQKKTFYASCSVMPSQLVEYVCDVILGVLRSVLIQLPLKIIVNYFV